MTNYCDDNFSMRVCEHCAEVDLPRRSERIYLKREAEKNKQVS
jgi:hypothetical protein